MVQFCYNDAIQVRKALIHVFEKAIVVNEPQVYEILSAVPYILHS